MNLGGGKNVHVMLLPGNAATEFRPKLYRYSFSLLEKVKLQAGSGMPVATVFGTPKYKYFHCARLDNANCHLSGASAQVVVGVVTGKL